MATEHVMDQKYMVEIEGCSPLFLFDTGSKTANQQLAEILDRSAKNGDHVKAYSRNRSKYKFVKNGVVQPRSEDWLLIRR